MKHALWLCFAVMALAACTPSPPGPKGDQGDPGPQGIPGPQGDPGPPGTFSGTFAGDATITGNLAVTGQIFANAWIEPNRFLYLPFNELAGNTAWDLSGYRQDGALVGGASRGPGRIGNGLLLNGTSGCVLINDTSVQRVEGFTVMAWLRREGGLSGSDTVGVILAKHHTVTARAWDIGVNSADYTFRATLIDTSDNAYTINSPANVTATLRDWFLVASVFDSPNKTLTLYVNGSSVGSQVLPSVVTPMATTVPISVGCYLLTADGSSRRGYFAGTIDEAMVFRRALTATEIASYYRMTSP